MNPYMNHVAEQEARTKLDLEKLPGKRSEHETCLKRIILRMFMLRAAQGLMICMLLPVSVSAQVFKWVDANGKIQYGDRPPAGKKHTEELNMAPVPQASAVSSNNWEQKDREFRKRRIEKKMLEEKEQASVSSRQICLNARYKLQMLDGKVVYRVNEKGERVYMEDTERHAIETKAREDIAVYCK